MRFGWWGTTAWAEPGSVHRCNEATKVQAGAPLGEPALLFFMRRK